MGEGVFAPVGVAVFGVSTPFAHWGFHLVCRVVEAITGTALHLHVASLQELRDGFARRNGASVVATSDFPDAELARFVCESELPIIVFSDDPGDAHGYAMNNRGFNAVDAARFASRLISAVAQPLTAERRLLVHKARDRDPKAIVAAVIEHLFPERGEWLATETFKFLLGAGHVGTEVPDFPEARRPGDHSDPLIAQIRTAVDSYAELTLGREPRELVWPLELFFRPDERPPRAAFDLTGPARVLLYGPYLHLPVGDWAVRFEFEIDEAVSGVEAATDIYINEVVTEKVFTMPRKGIYAYELGFRVEDPHVAAQIRLFTKKSAIEGKFLPRSVRVRPKPA